MEESAPERKEKQTRPVKRPSSISVRSTPARASAQGERGHGTKKREKKGPKLLIRNFEEYPSESREKVDRFSGGWRPKNAREKDRKKIDYAKSKENGRSGEGKESRYFSWFLPRRYHGVNLLKGNEDDQE